eukprot:1607870-Amphidinium_carterae.1
MRMTIKKGLHNLTEMQFAMVRRALTDQREGITDVNQVSDGKKFQGKTAKQISQIEPEIVAASSKLLTHVQEKQGNNNFAFPKGIQTTDIVSRDTYNLDDMTLVSSDKWNPKSVKKKESRLEVEGLYVAEEAIDGRPASPNKYTQTKRPKTPANNHTPDHKPRPAQGKWPKTWIFLCMKRKTPKIWHQHQWSSGSRGGD